MKKILCIVFSLFISLGSFAFFGCKANENLIRLNEVTHSIFYAPLYAAIELGYFEEENLKIKLTNGGGADRTMTALLSKNADIGLCGAEAGIYVYNEGRTDFAKVIGQVTSCDGAFLVSRKPEPDFKWSDLEGKDIIAGRTGGMPAMMFEYVLNQNGLVDGENITLIKSSIDFNNMGPAFIGGTGDYVALFEPLASLMEAQGEGYIVAAIGEGTSGIPETCFQVLSSYLNKNEEKIERFLRAIHKAQLYVQENDAQTIAEVLQPQFKDSTVEQIKIIVERYKSIGAYASTPVMQEESFTLIQDVIVNAGLNLLTKRVPFADMVYNDIAQRIVDQLA